MSPEDREWVIRQTALSARQIMDRAAETQVLSEMLADVLAHVSGKSYDDAMAEIQQRLKAKREKYLLEVDRIQPALAGLMDVGQPPPDVESPPPA